MVVAVLGDVQAVPVAAYAAAMSGAPVHVVCTDATSVEEVDHDGEVRAVEVLPTGELPAGQLEAVIMVAESRRLRDLLEPIAAQLAGVPLLLAPGGFGGVLRVLDWYAEWKLEPPLVAEATGFPVSGVVAGSRLTTRILKRRLPCASTGPEQTAYLVGLFSRFLPELEASDLVTTSLSNTNHMIHPGVVLLNAARVDNGEPFRFYREGISPALSSLLEAVDAERVAVAERVGAEALSVREWMLRFYADEGMAGPTIVDCLATFEPFDQVSGPTTLDYRYLVDDVPFGLAQWSLLARELGLPTPQMEALQAMLLAVAPHLDLAPDPSAAQLFRQFLATTQGVLA